MNKSFFNKIVKDMTEVLDKKGWTDVKHFEVDEDNLRFPLDTTFKWVNTNSGQNSNWTLEVNYNQSNDGEIKKVSERSIAFYLTHEKKGMSIYTSLYLFPNTLEKDRARGYLEVLADGVKVAQVDSIDIEESFARNSYHLLFSA